MALSERDAHFYTRRRCRESGQGVLEYILTLVVSIALVLGITYQFNDAFKVWANNYFGDYLSCLLESGELPTIGGNGGGSAVCDQLFQNFSLANGRPAKPSAPGGSSSGGSSSGNEGSQGRSDSTTPARAVSESSANNGYTRVNRGGGGSSAAGGPFNKNNPQDSEGGSGGGRRNVYTGNTDVSAGGGAAGTSGRGSRTDKDGGLNSGFFVSRSETAQERTTQFAAKLSDKSSGARKARFLVERKPAQTGKVPDDEPLTFGDYLRYILIAALILALVLVVGGQFLQISNEME